MSTYVKKITRWLKKKQLPKNHQWKHDFDYINKLSPEDQEFLAKFIKEYYDGNIKKGDLEALHATDDLRKDCYNRKNRGNRDMMAIMDWRGGMDRLDNDRAEVVDPNEDTPDSDQDD